MKIPLEKRLIDIGHENTVSSHPHLQARLRAAPVLFRETTTASESEQVPLPTCRVQEHLAAAGRREGNCARFGSAY